MKTLDQDFPPFKPMADELIAEMQTKRSSEAKVITRIEPVFVNEPAFVRLAAINVNDKIEKKNNLPYLSWAWAVDQLMRQDPMATWEYGEPVRWNDTVMVFCTVKAFGKAMTAQLPVMDHRNKAIANPDAFAVNTAMQRCLAKAIALHGLGLYIYAGEDLPLEENEETQWAESIAMPIRVMFGKGDIEGVTKTLNGLGTGGEFDGDAKELVWGRLESNIRSTVKAYEAIVNATSLDSLKKAWDAAPKHAHELLVSVKDKRKEELSAVTLD